MTRFRWGRVEHASFVAIARECGSTAALVYVDLCCYAGGDRQAWPKQSKLARELALSVGTVRRALTTLESAGVIEKGSIRSAEGGTLQNAYRLVDGWGCDGG